MSCSLLVKRDCSSQPQDADFMETFFVENADFSKLELTSKQIIDQMDSENKFKIIENNVVENFLPQIIHPRNNLTSFDFNILKEKEFQKIDISPSKDDIQNFHSLVVSTVRLERGNQMETFIVQDFNSKYGFNFTKNHSCYKEDFGSFRICGKTDGIDCKRRIIIEVKTLNSLEKPYYYSYILRVMFQCYCYMILTKTEKCFLVERDSRGTQRVHFIELNKKIFIKECLNKLKFFVDKYRNMSEEKFKSIVEKKQIILLIYSQKIKLGKNMTNS